MLTRILAIIVGVTAVAVLAALVSQSRNGEILETRLAVPAQTSSPGTKSICERPKQEMRAATVINGFDRLDHGDYQIRTRYKIAKLDVPRVNGSPPKSVKASYIIISKRGKVTAKFDDDLYTPLGNRSDAGFVSLLGNRSDQLVLSQDISRTGVQWVADFSLGFKIIFDGQKFRVGREAGDMIFSDLDDDGVYEIMVPMTDFYGFEGWRLSTIETPLPEIIFKYDPVQREYLPANPHFRECLLRDTEAAAKSAREIETEIGLGRLMSIVLDFVFVGEEARGWKLFEAMCAFPDKARIKSDMQEVLRAHPVYRYIYKKRSNR
jgi:hypothetical protein